MALPIDIPYDISETKREKICLEEMILDYSVAKTASIYSKLVDYSFTSIGKFNIETNISNRGKIDRIISENEIKAEGWSEGQFLSLKSKCLDILSTVDQQPEIFPTGRGSIQFEYEKDNGDYLEFEISLDSIDVLEIKSGIEKEFKVSSYSQIDQLVRNF